MVTVIVGDSMFHEGDWRARQEQDPFRATLRDQIDDNTNAAAVNDLLIKLQNVTAERDRLVDENKQVTIDYGIAVKSHNRQQEARVACKNEVDRLVSQLAAVTAERDEARAELAASEIELADKAFYVREFAAVSAERDAARAEKQTLSDELQRVTAERDEARAEARAEGGRNEMRGLYPRMGLYDQANPLEQGTAKAVAAAIRDRILAGVGQPSSNAGQFDADEVEALARVLQSAYSKHIGYWPDFETWTSYRQEGFRAEARAAIAHLRKRPEGLPTAEELKQVYRDGWNEGAGGDTCASGITAILAALAPWLREPVGWELDVPEGGWLSEGFCIHNPSTGETHSLDSFVSHVCSRIRPVYECQECAKWEARYKEMKRWHDMLDGKIESARAALEGE